MARKRHRKSKAPAEGAAPDDDRPSDVPEALPKDKEEEELEKLVFGDLEGFNARLRDYRDEIPDDDEQANQSGDEGEGALALVNKYGGDLTALQDDELFMVDEGPITPSAGPGPVISSTEIDTVGPNQSTLDKPAWEDSDDEKVTVSLASHARMRKLRTTEADDYVSGREYSLRLRRQFERIYPVPSWAVPDSLKPPKPSTTQNSDLEVSNSDDDGQLPELITAPSLTDLLQSTATLTAAKTPRLRPGVVDIARLRDANAAAPSKGMIQALSFHPSHPLLLTAGLDSTIRIFHIDGKNNPFGTSLHMRKAPLMSCFFHPDGQRIFASGRRRYFYVWNLAEGKVERVTRMMGHSEQQRSMERISASPDGKYLALIGTSSVQLLDAVTTQWISTAKVEGRVADMAWNPLSPSDLLIVNAAGEVYEYSLASSSTTRVWSDQGAVGITRIATSGRFIAIGSSAGIVNIYDRNVSFSRNNASPEPVKTLENLVSSINVLEFSRDGQVLAIASGGKKDALRLVHLPSCTVYRNWPTQQTPLGRVCEVTWGVGNVLAVGNARGAVRLFEIRGN